MERPRILHRGPLAVVPERVGFVRFGAMYEPNQTGTLIFRAVSILLPDRAHLFVKNDETKRVGIFVSRELMLSMQRLFLSTELKAIERVMDVSKGPLSLKDLEGVEWSEKLKNSLLATNYIRRAESFEAQAGGSIDGRGYSMGVGGQPMKQGNREDLLIWAAKSRSMAADLSDQGIRPLVVEELHHIIVRITAKELERFRTVEQPARWSHVVGRWGRKGKVIPPTSTE